jgi:hypothetical protein
MQLYQPQSFFLPISLEPTALIFAKYSSGSASASLPFKLYQEDSIPKVAKKLKKRNSRGPYRKYTSN